MVWSEAQRSRLAIEKNVLEKHFKCVTWVNQIQVGGYVDVKLTSNSNKSYTVRVYLNADFPNSCPDLVLVSPRNLKRRNEDAVPSTSSAFHTIGQRDGFLKLCHFDPDYWTQDITFYQVVMKARLWIEAYEGHLSTGNDMDVYLSHQARQCIIS